MNMKKLISQKIKDNLKLLSIIPRASGDEEAVSHFLLKYAQDRGLKAIQDDYLNVIIRKPATSEIQKKTTVILQGHMDMVYVKEDKCLRKYEDGIEVLENEDFLYADGTSLGADNGVAIAYMMLLMDSVDITHPNLEMVITVEEEIGLSGADKLDTSVLEGRYMINLDTENEGHFFVSCAGGVRNDLIIPLSFKETSFKSCADISIEGLKGGHSGLEIDKQRGNALVIMARLLNYLSTYLDVSSVHCDGKANAIPNKSCATIWIDSIKELNSCIVKFQQIINAELMPHDDVKISIKKNTWHSSNLVFDKKTIESLISTLLLIPVGVLNMDRFIPNLVETSVNIGSLIQDSESIKVTSSIRSSLDSRKNEIMDKIQRLSRLAGMNCIFYNNYPEWTYDPHSFLRKLALSSYEELTGKVAVETSIHAGLECGYFSHKMNNLDIISFGPNIYDVHTTKEKLDLKSAVNTFNLLLSILKKI